MRHTVGLNLAEIHRQHLGTQKRDAELEVSLHRGALPEANSMSLAAQLMGSFASPSEAVAKAEVRIVVQEALNGMDPIDREILALKHFEQLTTSEIGQVLGLAKAGAGSRYLRAIKRLRSVLEQIPGFVRAEVHRRGGPPGERTWPAWRLESRSLRTSAQTPGAICRIRLGTGVESPRIGAVVWKTDQSDESPRIFRTCRKMVRRT